MTRSKLSTKVILSAIGIGLSAAVFAASQPAAARNPFRRLHLSGGDRIRSDLRLYSAG